MKDLTSRYHLYTAGTLALANEHDEVVLRLLEFTGSRYDQPMVMVKSSKGYRMHYLHFSDLHRQSPKTLTEWLTALALLCREQVDDKFEVVTWTDDFRGRWITPELKIFYLGSFYLFESRPKHNYHVSVSPSMLCPKDRDRLMEYVLREANASPCENTELSGEGYIVRVRIDQEGKIHTPAVINPIVDMLVVDVHPHCEHITNDKVKALIIHKCRDLGNHVVMLKNIYVANYMSKRLMTDAFYDSLMLLTKERKTECHIA